MITHRKSGPADTGKRLHRRALSVGAGVLCLCAFSPLAMAATLVSDTGPGYVTSNSSSNNDTTFGYNFGGQNGLNVLNWDSAVGGDEDYTMILSINSAPSLSGTGNADPDTGEGMLRIRWTREPIINAAGAPEDDDWSGSDAIINLFGTASVSLHSSSITATYYEAVLAFNNPAASSAASIDYLWDTFNFSAGGPSSIELEPGYVPVPPALWLFGSGLLAVAGISRRRSEKAGPAAASPEAAGAH